MASAEVCPLPWPWSPAFRSVSGVVVRSRACSSVFSGAAGDSVFSGVFFSASGVFVGAAGADAEAEGAGEAVRPPSRLAGTDASRPGVSTLPDVPPCSVGRLVATPAPACTLSLGPRSPPSL